MTPSSGATRTVSFADRDRFLSEGFLVIPEFIDASTVAELRHAYDEILSGAVRAEGDRMLGGRTRQVMLPSQAHPVFDDNAAFRRGVEVASVLLGSDEVSRVFDMLIYKPPGHPEPTPWHQDFSYANMPFTAAGSAIPLTNIQFWVALDDADVENGCMHFIPGCQKSPLMQHRVASGDPHDAGRLLELVDAASQLDLSQAVACEIPAGGATLHSYGTPHYTPPNTSADRPRRAYIFTVGVTGTAPSLPYMRKSTA